RVKTGSGGLKAGFSPPPPAACDTGAMSIRYLPDSPPPFPPSLKRAAASAAAKADYLAGAGAPQVCERHGLALSTFRLRARQECSRLTDQRCPVPAPLVAAPDPAPQPQAERSAMAETEAGSLPQSVPQIAPRTAAEMARSAWDAS